MGNRPPLTLDACRLFLYREDESVDAIHELGVRAVQIPQFALPIVHDRVVDQERGIVVVHQLHHFFVVQFRLEGRPFHPHRAHHFLVFCYRHCYRLRTPFHKTEKVFNFIKIDSFSRNTYL